MTEKRFKARLIQTHDSDINWTKTEVENKGANFIPESGEIIVYEFSDGSRKFKIGNGSSKVEALPFQNTVGPQGEKGDKGDTGAHINSVAGDKTPAAGNTVTYTMKNSDGTTAGTFEVVNGTNGRDGTTPIILGSQITTSSDDNGSNIFRFTINGSNSDFIVKNGSKGSTGTTGTRGSRWNSGIAMTGTDISGSVFSAAAISDALVGDMYLNTSTGYVYQCILAGAADTAKWAYIGSIKGIQGNTGTTPKVTASASVDANSGTPSVTVTQNGSDAAPTFAFAFKNLRGAKGSDGVGVITNLNGSTTTDRTAYAPTTAGTSGYYLKSNGSGAPTWTSLTSLKNPNALTLTVNGTKTSYDGSTIESESWYAPTTAGTSGYYLVSSGSGAPTWSEGIDDGDID